MLDSFKIWRSNCNICIRYTWLEVTKLLRSVFEDTLPSLKSSNYKTYNLCLYDKNEHVFFILT